LYSVCGEMISRWLFQSLGQFVAPDEKIDSEREDTESIWKVVAPDPAWEASQHGGTVQSESTSKSKTRKSVPPLKVFAVSPDRTSGALFPNVPLTPTEKDLSTTISNSGFMSPLEKGVLTAAKGTAESMLSPPQKSDSIKKVFRLCASSKPLQEKLLQKLGKMLKQKPELLSARASQMGNLAPDGFTPLMACAYVNRVEAAELILKIDENTRTHVDLQGRTALHIASEMGSLDILRLLQTKNTLGPEAPVDLLGHTPLGRAVMSNHKAARRSQAQLSQALFSPGDKSIFGKPTPLRQRSEEITALEIPIGYSQMPGFRIRMEDAVTIENWEGNALVGVCDGHGDNAQISTFISNKVKEVYQNKSSNDELPSGQQWISTCLELDQMVKELGNTGGSTAVWAHITNNFVFVVNVGDCRCILIEEVVEDLIQESNSSGTEAEGVAVSGELVIVGESSESTRGGEKTAEIEGTPIKTSKENFEEEIFFLTKALSIDHKPDLAGEKLRIEKSGMKVIEETFINSSGLRQTIPKIELAEGRRMAVSRAFGDFEYKSNVTSTAPEDQAVSVIPFIQSHERSTKDAFLVLACDGIWDVMSNDEVGKFVMAEAKKGLKNEERDLLPMIGDKLCEECLSRGSMDNLSVVLVALSSMAEKVIETGSLGRKALSF